MLTSDYKGDAFLTGSGIAMDDLALLFATVLSLVFWVWFILRLMELRRGLQNGALSETSFLFYVVRTVSLVAVAMAFIHYLVST